MTNPVMISIDKLKQYPHNVKKHTKAQILGIAESIRKFGFYSPILLDKDYNIIAGHGRLEAATLLEMSEVPCIVLDHITEDEARALRLIDNKIAESEWNMDNLKYELENFHFDFDQYKVSFDDLVLPKLQDVKIDIDPSDQHMNSYTTGNLKQITLIFDNEGFEKIMKRIEMAKSELKATTNTEVFVKLLDWYENRE
jgi:hypothetical protein